MKVTIQNHGAARRYVNIEGDTFCMGVLVHPGSTSDADSLRRSAAEARAKAARELKRAERMERAAEQLTKGE